MHQEITPEIVVAFLTLAGAGIGVWVAMNMKVARLETKVEMLEKEQFNMRDSIAKGFEDLRKEIREDISGLRDIFMSQFNK